jgi:hypothetical protein
MRTMTALVCILLISLMLQHFVPLPAAAVRVCVAPRYPVLSAPMPYPALLPSRLCNDTNLASTAPDHDPGRHARHRW